MDVVEEEGGRRVVISVGCLPPLPDGEGEGVDDLDISL